MKLSKNRVILLCSKDKNEDIENYFKAKKIRMLRLSDTDMTALEYAIDKQIQLFKKSAEEESCITIILYEESCRLAFSLQQKTQAQLILINPSVNHVFGKDTAIIESDDKYQILLTIKHLVETGS